MGNNNYACLDLHQLIFGIYVCRQQFQEQLSLSGSIMTLLTLKGISDWWREKLL